MYGNQRDFQRKLAFTLGIGKTEFARLEENLARLKLSKIAESLPAYMADPAAALKPAVQVMRELTDA